ncbi:hypothetical protein [Desulfovibrio aminophilus]|nr:hypothetical protein [Desulfovibrio aminophilus]
MDQVKIAKMLMHNPFCAPRIVLIDNGPAFRGGTRREPKPKRNRKDAA